MSHTYSSLELRPSSRGPILHPSDGQETPNTAAMLAWRYARDTYRKSLSDKDFKRIMIPATPEDVLREIENWQSSQAKSRYCRVADGVQAGMSRLQKFNRAIDMIAQGSPAPGCLVWGSIVFVLTIVQHAAEEYTKLCKTLYRMIECLPRVETYSEAFLESSMVQDGVSAFYSSVLRFWTRACKFYRRRRLWNFVRVIWNDYDAEFKELEMDMVRCRDRVEASALAGHIGQSKVARKQQQTVNTSLLEAHSSSRQKEIIAWLAPAGYAVDYYKEDFANAKAARHANTCQWLLQRDAFVQFCRNPARRGAFLWIYAQPGAGKTVLAAFIIDYFALRQQSGCVLFFFCKDTDEDKRTPIAIARSLLYQLFHALRERAAVSALFDDISFAVDESGHQRALNFPAVWDIFSSHISNLTPTTIIVDALDECRDSETLIQSLRSMAASYNVAVILTSRKEEHLHQVLHQSPSIEIVPDDIDADVKAFVEAKVAASPRLSQPSVKHLIIKRLCDSHEGMFLWVQYMVKELKSCVSLQQVQEELRELPKGMDAVYQRILQRLQETLDKQTIKLCSKVLTWVTAAIRPLKVDELKQALQSHYLNEGHSLLSTDGSFPYSDKDIELVCGSLVTVRDETLQVVHLTVKQYIQSPTGPTNMHLLAETKTASLQLTLACLRFLKDECVKPTSELFPRRPIEAEEDYLDLSVPRIDRPFLEYSCFSWFIHLMDCPSIDALEISGFLYDTFDSPSTFGWIESCMALQPGSIPHLLIGLEDVRDWIDNSRLDDTLAEDSKLAFASNWCATIEQVLEEHGPIIQKRKAEIYYLDLTFAFAAHGLMDTYEKYGGRFRREKCLRFPTGQFPCTAWKKVPPHRQLPKESQNSLEFFMYEPNRNIFIWSQIPSQGQISLFAQSAGSGRQLLPMSARSSPIENLVVKDYAMSKDGRHLGIAYQSYQNGKLLSIMIWEIEVTLDFTRRMQASSWARMIHESTMDEHSVARLWSKPCIAFDNDGVCFTPNGRVCTASGANSFTPDNSIKLISARNPHEELDDAFYSADGKFLFVASTKTITKYALPSLEVDFQLNPSDKSVYKSMASPSGRYLVFIYWDIGLTAPDLAGSLEANLLVDTLLGNTMVLPDSPRPEEIRGDYVLRFSVDEREIVVCYLGHSDQLHIRCYTGLPNEIRMRASGWCARDIIQLSDRLYVSSDLRTANLATRSGEIQRIRLGDEIDFLDALDEPCEYPSRSDFLSQDAIRWARVYYNNDKAQIQIRTVCNPDETPRCIELQRTSWLGEGNSTFVTMSMDLNILVLNWDIYWLGDPKIGQLEIAPRTVELSIEMGISQSVETTRPSTCVVDHSNSHVAYIKRNRVKYELPNYPDILALFRINLDEVPSPRLQPSLPEDMFNISAQFHPSLPLLILGFGLISEARTPGLQYEDGGKSPFHVVIIDMNTMSKRAVEFEQEPSLRMANEYLEVGFSTFGDFAYIESEVNRRISKDSFGGSPTSYRYMQQSLAVDRAFYEIHIYLDCSIWLSLAKPRSTGWSGVDYRVYLENLAYVSSFYADQCQVFLLLGRTDDDYMHVLLIPKNDCAPELKTIPLTWAEARAKLDQKWEEDLQRWERREKEWPKFDLLNLKESSLPSEGSSPDPRLEEIPSDEDEGGL